MSEIPAIDSETKNWVKQELKRLEAQEDYSPVIPDVDDLVASWKVNNPKMFQRLERAKLTRQFAEVMLAKQEEERESLELAGYPPTDAREQAAINWYLEPEPDSQPPSLWEGMEEVAELLDGKRPPITIYRK